MYRMGSRTHHKHLFLYGLLAFVVLWTGILLAVIYMNRNQTVINQAPTVTKQVSVDGSPAKTFDEDNFSIMLPSSWKYLGRDDSIVYRPYRWQGTVGNDTARMLAVYVDNLPADMAVNRLLPLDVQNGRLVPGTVSDNCTTFTGGGAANAPSKNVTAKWAGVNFICDMENFERDVVGTGSAEGNNLVMLSGPQTGQHRLFFTFTDNSSQPDFDIFSSALASFKLK